MKIKIYYHHTDCGGVVYYAKYLEFLEEARSKFFEDKGIARTVMACVDCNFKPQVIPEEIRNKVAK